MSTQVQVRGAAQATQEARTLVSRELDVNTTDGRICVHNGSTAGGIPHVNYADAQNQEYTYAAGSGTNAITASLAKAPAAYQAGQKFSVKIANTNTGSATLNINSLGAKTIKALKSGAVGALSGGELVGGHVVDFMYDGTDMILLGLWQSGLTTVKQADLSTSTGTFSDSTDSSNSFLHYSQSPVVLPGGQYGFSIEVHNGSTNRVMGLWSAVYNSSSYSASMSAFSIGNSGTAYGQQRYVTSSPPFDLGDGEAGGFFFALLNKAGDIVSHYMADVPPWGYNGPTDIRCAKVCPRTGKKYRHVAKPRSFEEIMDGVPLEYHYDEITQKVKNADMALIPHPFSGNNNDLVPVLLDPMCQKIRNLVEHQNAGGGSDISTALQKGLFKIDNSTIKRSAPKGVAVHRLK